MILSRVTHPRLRTSTRLMLRCMMWLALVLSTSASQAQQTPEMVFEPAPGSTPAQASASASGFPRSHISGEPSPEDAGVGGLGVLGRVGHIIGNTIERNQSITYLDLSPYMFVEETYLFGDARLFLNNQGHMGGSAGLGVRQYFPRNDFVLGASAWYDRDDSRKATFEQLGMSFELFSQWMDVRANYYTGIGENVRTLGTTIAPGSAAFAGNNITFSTQTAVSTGADVVDLMFTVPVPGEIAQSMNLEASAGYYQIFTPSLTLKDVNGYKLRLDADFLDRVLHVYTELSQDSFFDTNLVLAADVNYWHHLESRPRFGSSQFNRIAQWVRRNRNVVTIDSKTLNPAQLAINPATGNPYFLYHVRNVETPPPDNFPAPAGLGTLEKPFQFIDEAQAAVPDADLIFVHADSVFDNRALVMNDGELILGEGVNQTIPVQGLTQQLPLPRATAGANRPLFRNTVGTAITLADNNLIAGFDIDDTQGTAIFGNAISGGTIRDIRIDGTTGAGAHGVHLQNSAGTISLQRVDISDTEENAFYISGGNAAVVYSSGTITNTSGYAVLVENNTGSVNMTGTTTLDTGGFGIGIFNSTGTTTLGTVTLTNTTGPRGHAIDIVNLNGGVSIFQDAVITNPLGDGIHIENLNGSVASLGTITINQRNAVGINLDGINASGAVSFGSDVLMGVPASGGVNDHGINFQNSAGSVSFEDVTIDGSNGAGINIGDRAGFDVNTGRFVATGIVDIDSAALSSIQVLEDSSIVTFNGTVISNRGNHGIEIFNHSGTTNFAGLNTIRNEQLTGESAVDVQVSSGDIAFGTVIASDTRGPDPGARIFLNTGDVSFASLSVESVLTTAVDIQQNTNVTIQGGTLDATSARAVTMIDNEDFGVVFDAVSSTNAGFGIFVQNDIALFDHPGSFTVTGDGTTPGSGGTISGHTVAGAFLDNVNIANLRFMEYLTNDVGVLTNDVRELTLFGDDVSGSASFGLDVVDSADILIQQSQFDSNEGFNQVRIRAAEVLNDVDTPNLPRYRFVIRDNIFTDATNVANVGAGDMISIATDATANNSDLQLLVEDNGRTFAGGVTGFSSNRFFGGAVLDTNWNGDVEAGFFDNSIRMSALSGQVGMRLVTTRSASVSDVIYQGNVLNDGGGSSDIGLNMDFAGSALLSIVDNFGVDANGNAVVDGFLMNGAADVFDTAIDLVFRSTNNAIDISRNNITFNSNIGTGILFESISGPSTVNMDGNRIILFDQGFFLNPEQGIVFQSVVGNITLSSLANQNNVILPTTGFRTVPLTIPGGVSTGTFLINGQRLP